MSFKKDFPIFANNPWLVFLDSWASSQKPAVVIDGVSSFVANDYANIHRWAYDLAERSQDIYEASKVSIAKFLNAKASEIIYTYNASYASNMLAYSLIRSKKLQKGDHIILNSADHHANIVPWQILQQDHWIDIDFVDLTTDYDLNIDHLHSLLRPQTKLFATASISNVTWTVYDLLAIKKILPQDVLFVVDASQSLAHEIFDVQKYDCDFVLATAHKMFAYTWLGVLWAKREHIKTLTPAFWAWATVLKVTKSWFDFLTGSQKFEPWTPNIISAASLEFACKYIESIGWYPVIQQQEELLKEYFLQKFNTRLKEHFVLLWKTFSHWRIWVFSLYPKNLSVWVQQIGELLSMNNICVRTWWHCAHPLHQDQNVSWTLRISLAFYNDVDDIDMVVDNLDKIAKSYTI